MESAELPSQRHAVDRDRRSEVSLTWRPSWQERLEQFVEDSWQLNSPQRVAQAVLIVAAVGAVVTAAAVAPGITALLRPFARGRSLNHRSVYQAVRRLERRGAIKRKTAKNSVSWELTSSGRARLDRISINDLTLPPRPPTWDGEWRIVFFDVPEERRVFRAIFRRKLQSLGFQYLQRSVWIYPYPCETVLRVLADRLQLGDHIHIAGVHLLSSDTPMRQRFRIDKQAVLPVSTARSQRATGANRISQDSHSSVIETAGFDSAVELLPIEEL